MAERKSQAFVENGRCLILYNDVKFCINTNQSIKLYSISYKGNAGTVILGWKSE